MAHHDKVSTTCGVPNQHDEEVVSITEHSSSSFTGGEEGGDGASGDGDVLHPDLVSYSNDSLHDLDDREVSLDKLQWILSEISESNDRFRSFVEDEGFLDVLDEMVDFPEDEEIQSRGLTILIHFFRFDAVGLEQQDQVVGAEDLVVNVSKMFIKKLEESFIKEGLHKVLAHAILTFTGNGRLLAQAFTLLLRVAKDEQVWKYCTLPRLVLWSIARNLELKVFISSALGSLFCRLKHDSLLLKSLAGDGVLTVLSLVLNEYRGDAPILRSAFQLIFLLLDKDEGYRSKAVGIGPSITRAMGEHLDDPSLLMACSGILWHISNEGAESKVRLAAEARAVTFLVRVLLRYACNYKLQVLVCGALCSLSLTSDHYVMRALVKSRAADALGASLYQHPQRDHVVHPAFAVLSRMDEFIDRQRGAGGTTAET